jgi:hypothetical protein
MIHYSPHLFLFMMFPSPTWLQLAYEFANHRDPEPWPAAPNNCKRFSLSSHYNFYQIAVITKNSVLITDQNGTGLLNLS